MIHRISLMRKVKVTAHRMCVSCPVGKVQVLSGDCVQVMRALEDSSVDAVVTDPPYALNFMGKSWDSFAGYVERNGSSRALGDDGGRHDEGYRNMKGHESEFQAWCEIWAAECLRVLKPGGYLLAFGGTRTYHRLACGIEDAGFEIRDSIHWLYGSGMPKAKACLKPAHEPIVMARKPARKSEPLPGLDRCRIPTADRWEATGTRSAAGSSLAGSADGSLNVSVSSTHEGGRWPPNILLTHAPDCQPLGVKQVKGNSGGERNTPSSVYGSRSNMGVKVHVKVHGYVDDHGMETVEAWDCAAGCPVAELDTQSGKLTSGTGAVKRSTGKGYRPEIFGMESRAAGTPNVEYGDTGGASRFFPVFRYQAKAPSRERPKDNVTHPTVKPLELMKWLVRLVTPPAGIVLDPFAGSGTTGEACAEEGFRCILIEREPDYLRLIRKRLDSREPMLWDDAA
jgi:site-specific DNA-methyltransferase (adenine-specific)